MAEYIEKNTAIAKLTRLEVTEPLSTMIDAKRMLADMPAADVAPVRRGHWVRVGNGTTCSECMQGLLRINGKQSEWVDLSGMPYCPNCGAKMEVEYDERGRD
jgi:hypothetical protein